MTINGEHIPPSVQVITRLPIDIWKPDKIRRSEAIAHANTMLPIHARHAAGCKVCFFGPCEDKPHRGQIPCPICLYVIPCGNNCITLTLCCFGVPVPVLWPSFACNPKHGDLQRGEGGSFIFRGDHGDENCQWIVLDKESGISNVYCTDQNCKRDDDGDVVSCSCVPITKVHKVHIKPSTLHRTNSV
jgi:hypothetical protein